MNTAARPSGSGSGSSAGQGLHAGASAGAAGSAAPHILLVDDDPDLLRLLTLRLRAAGHAVQAVGSAEAALAHLALHRPALVISDVRLPGQDGLQLFDQIRSRHPVLPVILLTAHGTIPDAVAATARGAHAYLTKPFDGRALQDTVQQALQWAAPAAAAPADGPARGGANPPGPADERAAQGAWRRELISRSPVMAAVLAEARLVAATDASVLITGESGTGKELLARAIHRASPRAAKPFVAVNCAAIPEPLLESELFGHARGAFTGAQSARKGLFVAAEGGTLFLDEIGDMPLALQVKLLRVLQERQVRPVGTEQSLAVDVRVLSATHRQLDAALAAGQFRSDLYYRLNVVRLALPPLAQRREDIVLLAQHFLHSLASRYRKTLHGFAPEALEALVQAPWPGNVRQLHNAVEQVCALATGALVPLSLVQRALHLPNAPVLDYASARQQFERDYLIGLLKLTAGQVADAARLAQRNRTEFYRLLQRHGLQPQLFRDGADALSPSGDTPGPGPSSTWR
ncbi:sigma 54-interacting transcriptional regulator [Aquabacterium sp. OR-4]|uniref:sigma 54-interacting transcriptional regulator n=1 Tax=Aquabacterium sp. OR-4 TaxID=2978127 RepID=UPI0021B1D0AA|nr:sigma 54-interacting transcriptional regulator [Aquabacterium sp. OR-4]MDT7834066.1 sigma 54-interacting transcriptional regulator [Aquabacterium sp. OR-4]